MGLGFLFPEVDSSTALYLVTGAPTLSLIDVGLVLVPPNVAMARSEGTFEYIFSLPVPRLAFLFADLTIWLLAVISSVILALVVGAARYEFDLQIHPAAAKACFSLP